MAFKHINNTGGIIEKSMFAEAIQKKNQHLYKIYTAVEESIKEYDEREGYIEIDDHKEELKAVKLEIEEASQEMSDTVDGLRG